MEQSWLRKENYYYLVFYYYNQRVAGSRLLLTLQKDIELYGYQYTEFHEYERMKL